MNAIVLQRRHYYLRIAELISRASIYTDPFPAAGLELNLIMRVIDSSYILRTENIPSMKGSRSYINQLLILATV